MTPRLHPVSDRVSLLLALIFTGLGLAIASLAGCCDPASGAARPAYPTATGGGRTPQQQAEAAAAIQSVCVQSDGHVDIGYGSGVLVADGAVMTAYHVAECKGAPAFNVVFPDGKVHKGELEVADMKADIAILHLEDKVPAPPLAYGPKPHLEERVCVVSGIPSRERRCGEVTGYSDFPGDVRHTAITEPGNSGSGVYDSRGRLIGIVTHLVKCSNGQYCGGFFSTVRGSQPILRTAAFLRFTVNLP